jgi:cellulose synthase/poly-beta-1,6-N-acetylglucosamine synthase-like glycosyltransferase
VLIPAHNEEQSIANAIEAIRSELGADIKAVVVADHCTDKTPDVVRALGINVIENRDPEPRGKGHALQLGARSLDRDPPDVVIVIDADCIVAPGSIGLIALYAFNLGRPVQARYEMEVPHDAGPLLLFTAFTFSVRNVITGLHRLGLPSQLMGSGMAFPWTCLERVSFAETSDDRVGDDLRLGLLLAASGHPPLYCPDARVTSRLPKQRSAGFSQRQRWEHGSIMLMLQEVPSLLLRALVKMDVALLVLCLDLLVPPLALLVFLLVGGLAVSSMAHVIGGSYDSGVLFFGEMLLLFIAMIGAWLGYGRDRFPFWVFLAAPAYLLWQVPMYFRLISDRQMVWGAGPGEMRMCNLRERKFVVERCV